MKIKLPKTAKNLSDMTLEEYKENLKLLEDWNYEYYINDNPSVSDAQYDSAMFRVMEFEKNNPDKKDKFSVTAKSVVPSLCLNLQKSPVQEKCFLLQTLSPKKILKNT